jgi:hypothetical protein
MPSQIAENVPPDLAARTQIKTTGAENRRRISENWRTTP